MALQSVAQRSLMRLLRPRATRGLNLSLSDWQPQRSLQLTVQHLARRFAWPRHPVPQAARAQTQPASPHHSLCPIVVQRFVARARAWNWAAPRASNSIGPALALVSDV